MSKSLQGHNVGVGHDLRPRPSHHGSLILEHAQEKLEADDVQLLVSQVQPVISWDASEQIPGDKVLV